MKRAQIKSIGILSILIALSSCANVTFHNDAALKNKTGLKFYNSKPYLLMTYTGSKENPIKTEILSLPDLENPVYAVYHPGWGSHNFTLSTNANGTISSYGQTADSKGPETIASLGGLLSSAGSAYKSIAEGRAALRAESADLTAVEGDIRDAIAALSAIVLKKPEEIMPFELKQEAANSITKRLNNVLSQIEKGDLTQDAVLAKISDSLDKAKIEPVTTDAPIVAAINDSFKTAKSSVDRAIKNFKAATGTTPAEKPDFILYEIRVEGGVTSLVQVSTSTARKILGAHAGGK